MGIARENKKSMNLAEFREKTKDLPDDTEIEIFDAEYDDSYPVYNLFYTNKLIISVYDISTRYGKEL